MAPKAVPAPIVSPPADTTLASDDSVSPPAPSSVHGRQQRFLQALDEASKEAEQEQANDVFPYGISVPFKVRDSVPGNKSDSARVFLAEAPIQALKDMCFYLQIEENGSIDDLVGRIVDYFIQIYPEVANVKASKSARSVMQQKLASGPTPVRARAQTGAVPLSAESSAADLKARLVELGKKDYGSKETLFKRVQEAEAELAAQKDEPRKKRVSTDETTKPAKKTKTIEKAKSTENLQDEYCVAGLSIAQQLKMAMEMSMTA